MKLLSMHNVHLSVVDIDQLYSLYVKGGQGIQQIESTYQLHIVELECYLCNNSDLFMQMAQKCDDMRSLIQSEDCLSVYCIVTEESG